MSRVNRQRRRNFVPSGYDGGYAIELEDREALCNGAHKFQFSSNLKAAEVPDEVDPRKWGKRVEMQGGMGSCQGHSLTSCMEDCIHWEHGVDVQLSRTYAYYETQKVDGLYGWDQGSTIWGGIKLAQKGVCEESLAPYSDRYNTNFRPTQEMLTNASLYTAGAYVNLLDSRDPFDAAVEWIGAYGCVHLGITWPPERTADDGIINVWQPQGRGGHAISGCGYVNLNSQRVILVANSWGTRWGKGGYMYWTKNAWNAMARHQYTAMAGITSCTSPTRKPRAWSPDDFSLMGG